MSADSKIFRNALGLFTTGVTVVTTRDSDENPVGMTANSFSSLSLEPPLVLWSIAKSSSNYATFADAKEFAIHILNQDQKALARQFSRKDIDRFSDIETETGLGRSPLLPSFLARFECNTEHRHEGGDHLILIGRVKAMDTRDGEPLIFFKGNFESL